MRDVRSLLADARLRQLLALAAACALTTATVSVAIANVARSPRHAPVVTKPAAAATPVFVPRADLKVRPVPVPTPLLAMYRSLPIHLPIKPKQITLIAFHQAGSRPVALPMRSLVSIVRSSALVTPTIRSKPATGPDESAEIAAAEEQVAAPTVYSGPVLRLWRSGRSGDPDTAVDVGTKPGAPVYAPVTGTVAAVHRYRLYGEYDDYEIHILPKGWDDLDCTILHVSDPVVKVGDAVVGGVTRIASVRWLSRWFDSQLDDYTHDGGNHVHVQLDRRPNLGAVQLMGGLEAEFGKPKVRATPTPRQRPGAPE